MPWLSVEVTVTERTWLWPKPSAKTVGVTVKPGSAVVAVKLSPVKSVLTL